MYNPHHITPEDLNVFEEIELFKSTPMKLKRDLNYIWKGTCAQITNIIVCSKNIWKFIVALKEACVLKI